MLFDRFVVLLNYYTANKTTTHNIKPAVFRLVVLWLITPVALSIEVLALTVHPFHPCHPCSEKHISSEQNTNRTNKQDLPGRQYRAKIDVSGESIAFTT